MCTMSELLQQTALLYLKYNVFMCFFIVMKGSIGRQDEKQLLKYSDDKWVEGGGT